MPVFTQTSMPEKSFVFSSIGDESYRSSLSHKAATSSLSTGCGFFKPEDYSFPKNNSGNILETEAKAIDSTSKIIKNFIIFFLNE